MEQKPIAGQDPLAPPDSETASQYLAAAQAVVERRDRAVDRPALARLEIGNAVVTAAYLVAFALVLRRGDVLASQIVLFTFLVWGQLSSGMAQRTGLQWRMTRSRLPFLLGGGAVLIGALVVFGFAALDTRLPEAVVLLPAAVVLVGIGGHGVVQLLRASNDSHRSRPGPVALKGPRRWGTALVGIAIGVLTMLAGSPDDVLRSAISLLVMLCLVAWIAVSTSEVGLPAIGASWRWPHVLVFLLAACVPVTLVLGAGVLGDAGWAGVWGGVAVIVCFAVVTCIPGRAERD
ncbi:hypothetical protein [Microbacterium sp. NPDC079208]|uniref:hypothetical protein n=1 Tax=Microbacterium sp. NPDC079208 TaxID=3154652 RepID=UPI00344ECF31